MEYLIVAAVIIGLVAFYVKSKKGGLESVSGVAEGGYISFNREAYKVKMYMGDGEYLVIDYKGDTNVLGVKNVNLIGGVVDDFKIKSDIMGYYQDDINYLENFKRRYHENGMYRSDSSLKDSYYKADDLITKLERKRSKHLRDTGSICFNCCHCKHGPLKSMGVSRRDIEEGNL